MQYICYDCNKNGIRTELSNDIDKRFIANNGRCLCEKCSEGVEPINQRELEIIKENLNR